MAPRWFKRLATAPLAMALVIGSAPSARALVPYVYVPKGEELEAAGLGIAQAATRLLRLGQADDAARLAALTVQLLPNDPRGWVLLAEAQLRSNEIKAAGKSLARAKELDPRNPGIWFAEGSLALRDGQPGQAVGLLETGLSIDGKNPGAHFDLGNARLLLNDPQAALRSFERASGLRRDFWEAINNQGLVLYELGRNDDAIRRWRRALEINPKAAEPMLALAAALNARPADQQEALQMASEALAIEPNYVLEAYQKEQLWGPRLRDSTRLLLENPAIKAATDRANANATGSSEGEDSRDDGSEEE
ncbi:tetratricopeptide repeat protein [Synechococcus sp. CS-205]|uniref:tetratricopeptide repeat protein n=1 Tax=Synechococcus sp. CS-205 TaxID=2847984 RepID=UPI00223C0AC3|nr:tetratricopeptide repeat protein [Synechococcus sp. CS-205]MCT0248950.1 tetratricopeptide repeat protein [Synechococcus sp. CS-205]